MCVLYVYACMHAQLFGQKFPLSTLRKVHTTFQRRTATASPKYLLKARMDQGWGNGRSESDVQCWGRIWVNLTLGST